MSLKQKAFSGLIWSSLQYFGNAGVTLIVQIILTKLISPEQFGLLGLILIFNAVGKTISDSGLSQSVIRTERPNDDDYSSLFIMSLVFAIIVYFILFVSSPLISDFYNQHELISLIRIYGLIIPISALQTVQVTKLTKDLNFRLQTIIQLPSVVISGAVGILLGYFGYGVWSLVYMQLIQSISLTIFYWLNSGFVPVFRVNFSNMKFHLRFGYKLLISGLLDSVLSNVYPSVVGRYNQISEVGYYTRATTFRQFPVNVISSAFGKVTYPILAEIQNDDNRLVYAYRRLLKIILLLTSFVMSVLILTAEDLIPIILTDEWIKMIPYFQWLCVIGILYPVHVYYLDAIKVKGRSDLFLKAEFIKKGISLTVLFITAPLGIMYIIYGQIIASILNLIVNQFFCRKVINYSLLEQNKDILLIIIPSILLLLLFLLGQYFFVLNIPILLELFLTVFVFSILYVTTHWFFNRDSLEEFNIIIQKIKPKK